MAADKKRKTKKTKTPNDATAAAAAAADDVITYDSWREEVEERESTEEGYLGANLEACITVACSGKAHRAVTSEFLDKPGVFAAFGCHPLSAAEWNDDMEALVRRMVSERRGQVVAVGECGLDYYMEREYLEKAGRALASGDIMEAGAGAGAKTTNGEEEEGGEKLKLVLAMEEEATRRQRREVQWEVFIAQMKMATELDTALVVHTREAEEDTLRLMREHLPRDARVHVHCFTSSLHLARELLESFPNLCIGFTGVVTFKNAPEVREVVAATPLDRILLETDGPYMAPVPHRGEPAHPGHVPHIATKIAEVKGCTVEDVFRAARENTRRVYGF